MFDHRCHLNLPHQVLSNRKHLVHKLSIVEQNTSISFQFCDRQLLALHYQCFYRCTRRLWEMPQRSGYQDMSLFLHLELQAITLTVNQLTINQLCTAFDSESVWYNAVFLSLGMIGRTESRNLGRRLQNSSVIHWSMGLNLANPANRSIQYYLLTKQKSLVCVCLDICLEILQCCIFPAFVSTGQLWVSLVKSSGWDHRNFVLIRYFCECMIVCRNKMENKYINKYINNLRLLYRSFLIRNY